MTVLRNSLLVASLLSAPLIGCTPTDSTSDEAQPESTAENDSPHAEDTGHVEDSGNQNHDDHAAHGGADGLTSLALNDGEKWQMDTHTRESIVSLNETVADVTVESAESGQQIGVTLNEQLKTLIRGCTMDGASHDNLHVFLEAFMPAVNKLEAAASTDEARHQLGEIQSMLQTYEQHFE